VILMTGDHLVPRFPWALIIVLGSVGLMHVIDPKSLGISTVGTIPGGLPCIGPPPISLPEVTNILNGAFGIFVLAYVEGMGMVRTFASKHGYKADPNQELLALGFASIGAGFTQSYPLGGSLSRSALNDSAGAKTQLAGGFSALLIVLLLLFLTGIFSKLPEPILAAVVLAAVRSLFKWKKLTKLFELSGAEFVTALGAFVGVLCLGILDGVMIGALLSLILVLKRTSQSHISLLGRVPCQPQFSSIHANPENIPVPGMSIIRANAGIFYANADSIKENILEVVRKSDEPVRAVVLEMAMTGDLDLAGAQMLAELNEELKEMGISLRLARMQQSALYTLDRLGISAQIGEGHIHEHTLFAVAQYLDEEGLSERFACDILPDIANALRDMVRERAALVKGEEHERLDAIGSKLEEIVSELQPLPCETE